MSAESKFTQRADYCLVAKSSQTSEDTLALAKEAVDQLLNSQCGLVREPLVNPFAVEVRQRAKEEWRGKLFLIWLDERQNQNELMIRLILLGYHLQWAMDKQKLPSGYYSEPLLRRSPVLAARIQSLFSEFPFSGYVTSEGFAFWGKPAPVLTIEKARPEAHGLLPIALDWNRQPWKVTKASPDWQKRELKLSYPDQEKLQFPLWISSAP